MPASPLNTHFVDPTRDVVAIVGIGCRFPGDAASPEAFWRLLVDEIEAVGEVPPGRWDAAAYHDPAPTTPGRIPTRKGAFLADVAGFDAPFFGMSPAESADADPQQRLALELAWEALEDAGVAAARIRDTDAGVYMGVKFTDYDTVRARGGPAAAGPFTSTGSVEGLIANRVSHFLGLRGPSMAVNASCAGSLIAVHLACQAIRAGECELALAGGVQLNLVPDTAVALAQLGVLSPDGRCHTFDAGANGYVRGEGGAVVVLKPYRQALHDGDRVYCVLRATATNNNGPNASLPASSAAGQRHLLESVVRRAGVDPTSIDYVEAHGTGTAVGDPAELTALAAVYGAGRAPGRPLLVGSVKTNIGHLEAAAGIAGLVKLALSLYHRTIPPSLHCPRPVTERAGPGVRVADTRTPWPPPDPGRPPRGGVSAFGFGGSNAHAIVEAVPAPSAERRPRTRALLVASAQNPAALRAAAGRLADHLDLHPELALDDLALSAGRRTAFAVRTAMVVSSPAEAASRLRAVDPRPEAGRDQPAPADGVVFLVTDPPGEPDPTGWLAAGRELYRDEPVFARTVDAVAAAAGGPPLDLHREPGGVTLAIFAVRLGLAALLRAWGVAPAAVIGDGPAAGVVARHLTGRSTLAEACAELARAGEASGGRIPPGGVLVHLGPTAGGLAALVPGLEAGESLLSLLGALYLRGVEPDWRALYPDGRIVSLPTYPFQRQPHWLPEPAAAGPPVAAAAPPARVLPAELPARVAVEVAGALGVAEVTPDATFESLGMGSLDATELRRRLEAAFGLRIPAAAVWGYPSVQLLTEYLRTLLTSADPPPAADEAPADDDEALIRLGERLLG